tara:strand:+ start:751 stop:1092 length:342 start_codon:yes stop_codon:yes gene_type:complete
MATDIVLSGMKTATIAKLLDSNKSKLDQRKRQADRLFTLHATAGTDEESADFYNLFELVVQEIGALDDNVEMFQTALTKRIQKYNADAAMKQVREAVEANSAPRYPRTTKISK